MPITKSKLTLLAAGQIKESERQGGEARKRTLFGKPDDWEESRLAPQNNHLTGIWTPGSFIDQRRGRWGSKAKRPLSCKHLLAWQDSSWEYVNFFLPAIHRWTGFWTGTLTVRQRGRVLLLKPLLMIVITKALKRKSKKQFPAWSQNWLLLCNTTKCC